MIESLFVVGAQGYTDEPIAVFDTWEDAYTIAKRVWPNADGKTISDRIHKVPYIESIICECEKDES